MSDPSPPYISQGLVEKKQNPDKIQSNKEKRFCKWAK